MSNSNALANKQPHRTYAEYQVIQAVSLYNLYHDYQKVSKELDIPVSTIQSWVKGDKGTIPVDSKIQDFSIRTAEGQKRLLDAMSFVMTEALQQVHSRIQDTSAAQAATIFGILFDKMQIMLGNHQQVTNNNILIDMSGMSQDDKSWLMQRVLSRQENNSDNSDCGNSLLTGQSSDTNG